jgi:transposase
MIDQSPSEEERMRGNKRQQDAMFSYVSLEDRVPADHPLRRIKALIDPVLESMSKVFDTLYAETGRQSIPPEYLLKATPLQMLYSIRSERSLVEEINYNLLFRWFIGLSMDDEVWEHSSFTKNRDRLLDGDIATKILQQVLSIARNQHLLSDEHFTVDGTLVEAWASQKSFQPRTQNQTGSSSDSDDPSNPTVNFRGQQRKNDTHQSTTDPEAKMYRKGSGKEARLSFMGHVLVDNRHSLIVQSAFTQATGTAEREAGISMLKKLKRSLKRCTGRSNDHRITLGADKGYDTQDFVADLRDLIVTPHVAQNDANNRTSAIDKRTTRHEGYQVSQRKRKQVEEGFGWLKVIALLRKIKLKGTILGNFLFTFGCAVYDLLRISNIITQQQETT